MLYFFFHTIMSLKLIGNAAMFFLAFVTSEMRGLKCLTDSFSFQTCRLSSTAPLICHSLHFLCRISKQITFFCMKHLYIVVTEVIQLHMTLNKMSEYQFGTKRKCN